jgi:hypothetical protein
VFAFLGSLAKTIVGGAIGAAIGWYAANFIAKPIRDFYDLRRRAHEELIVTGNIVLRESDEASDAIAISERQRYERAYEALRRLDAQLAALNVSCTWPELFSRAVVMTSQPHPRRSFPSLISWHRMHPALSSGHEIK